MTQFVAPGVGGGTPFAALLNSVDQNGGAFDVALLDRVVGQMYDPTSAQHRMASQALLALQRHPRAWSHVAAILERSAAAHTKVFAMKILEATVRRHWNSVPARPLSPISQDCSLINAHLRAPCY